MLLYGLPFLSEKNGEKLLFTQDGSPPHYTLNIHGWINNFVSERKMSCQGLTE